MVTNLVAARLRLRDGRIQRRGLAAAGRTRDQQHAVRQRAQAPQSRDGLRSNPRASSRRPCSSSVRACLSSMRSTASSPYTLGMMETRKSIGPALQRDLEPAVLRHAPLRDVEFAHYLEARDDLLGNLGAVDRCHRHQYAVDAVAHHQPGVRRLHVDVAGAGTQRVEYRRVHEFDDRAGIHVDRRQREIFHLAARTRAGLCSFHGRIDGAKPDLVARQVAGDVRARRDRPVQGGGYPDFQPRTQIRIERIRDDCQQPVRGIDQHAVAAGRVGGGQQIEGGLESGKLRRTDVPIVKNAP